MSYFVSLLAFLVVMYTMSHFVSLLAFLVVMYFITRSSDWNDFE